MYVFCCLRCYTVRTGGPVDEPVEDTTLHEHRHGVWNTKTMTRVGEEVLGSGSDGNGGEREQEGAEAVVPLTRGGSHEER